jgi:GTP-binding protein HflX
MDELASLLKTAGGTHLFSIFQSRNTPEARTFIGSGKVEFIKGMVEELGADLVIFDNALSPSQMRVLTKEIGVQVMDRSGLILDIFASRAKTREGVLQVQLAQYKYLLPRLTGMWGHLTKQTASGSSTPIGTRGPGETQLESDRRHIRRKITKLEEELREVQKIRGVQRNLRQKNNMPVVALVGYTNAGKSTLMNKLTGADVPANDRLFDTLDTTTRTLRIDDTCTVLLSDTVGFINKLPHQLIDAFKATLEELTYADLLIHVIDGSNPHWEHQAATVRKLITELGAHQTPIIEVYNKSDLYTSDTEIPHGKDIAVVSAQSGEGFENLSSMISQRIEPTSCHVTLHLPYDQGARLDELYRTARVINVDYSETIDVEVECSAKLLGQLRGYL